MKQDHICRLEHRASSGQKLNKKERKCLESKDIFDAIVEELERLLNPKDKQANKPLAVHPGVGDAAESNSCRRNGGSQNVKELKQANKSLAVDPGVGDAAESSSQMRNGRAQIGKQLVSSSELADALTFATAITKPDDEHTEKMFKEFLTGCKLNVNAKSICTGLAKSMIECGSGRMEIKYSYLEWHNKTLAMKMCRASSSLITRLTACAKSFTRSVWETDCKAPSPKEIERVHNLLEQFRVVIEGMPKSHRTLPEFMKFPMLRKLEYNRHQLTSPTASANRMIYGILNDVISTHIKGNSWNGKFSADNIEVYNDTKFTITRPAEYSFDPTAEVSEEVAGWLMKDFTAAWDSFGPQFYDAGAAHFRSLQSVLINTPSIVFRCPKKLKVFHEVVIHHAAAKPPIARANFLSGLHSCCRAYDRGDQAAPFKETLHGNNCSVDWQKNVKQSYHNVIQQVFSRSCDNINDVPEPGSKYVASDGMEFNSRSSFKRYLSTGNIVEGTNETYGSYVDYQRHLFVHGIDHTKEYLEFKQVVCPDGTTLYTATNNGSPRVQSINNLEVLEIIGAQDSAGAMTELIWALLNEDAMTGMLHPFWEIYKNCGF